MIGKLYIVELSNDDIRAIAQGLHVIATNRESPTAEDALKSLAQQAPNIKQNAWYHKVYPNKIVAPSNAIDFNSVCYVPLI